jgi:hypothetical protein
MAMNKKEREAHEAALNQLRIQGALRFTTKVEFDVPPPLMNSETQGWRKNSVSMVVDRGWSESVAHGSGESRKTSHSGSQGCQWLYSTKLLALKALRNAIEMKAAEQLAAIDLRIEQEEYADKHKELK